MTVTTERDREGRLTFRTSLNDSFQVPPANTMTDAEAHINWLQLVGFFDRQEAKERRLLKERGEHAQAEQGT